MKPQKHAEVIKAWADGAEIEYRNNGLTWACATTPTWDERVEFRIKPAAPKWPQTTMTEGEITLSAGQAFIGEQTCTLYRSIINAAIAHECSTGALVPAEKVREIEAKARAEGKREGMNPVHVIEAAWRHMKLGRLDPETIQIILLQAAK